MNQREEKRNFEYFTVRDIHLKRKNRFIIYAYRVNKEVRCDINNMDDVHLTDIGIKRARARVTYALARPSA